MKRKIGITLVFMLIALIGYSQSDTILKQVSNDWKPFHADSITANRLFDHHKQLKTKYQGKEPQSTYNDFWLIFYLGERAAHLQADQLVELPEIDLNNGLIAEFMSTKRQLLNDYYTLKAIKNGDSYESARSGMLFNTSFGGVLRPIDYRLMRDVFASSNEPLIDAYLTFFRMGIRYNGLTQEMIGMRPSIENLKDSELKTDILAQYDLYKHLMRGQPAPEFALKDFKGNEYKLSDYRGKVVVIDIWATWCGGCIEKLPYFLQIRDQYKANENIVFMVISIDNKAAYNKWKFSHPKRNLMDIISLIASEEECSLSKDYNITGIPRYLVIDRDGKIVSVYAPAPGKELVDMIENTLK